MKELENTQEQKKLQDRDKLIIEEDVEKNQLILQLTEEKVIFINDDLKIIH